MKTSLGREGEQRKMDFGEVEGRSEVDGLYAAACRRRREEEEENDGEGGGGRVRRFEGRS